ncbi:MAG: D-glycero-beta-D-manno-heptose 1,7-bisphosphate 7-phosphatase [Thermodesulfobacteriota bacterium]
MGNKAVFLDRDGTINEEVGYVNHIDRFVLLPRVGEAIRSLNQNGFKVVVVTNQSGVARGYFPETLVHLVHQKMEELLRKEGAYIDGIYYCPHHPDVGEHPYRQSCRCRKPNTGLIEEAVKALQIDCTQSYLVGDRGKDIEFGHLIGVTTILVLTGYGKGDWQLYGHRWEKKPHHVAKDLYEAVQWILKNEANKGSGAFTT